MPGTMAVGMCFNPSSPWKPEEGCAEMHCTSGMSRFRRFELPMKVPLVPMQATKCVSEPAGLLHQLDRGAFEMGFPVRRIVILIGIKITIGIGFVNFAAEADGAVGAFGRIGKNHLRAVGFQDLLALLGGVSGQAELDFITLDRADHRVGDSGVAGGRVEQDFIVGEAAGSLAIEDHVEAGAVLHRPAGIENSALA